MTDDIDELLGDVTPPKEPAALPRMEEFYRPVGVTFLADVFRLDTRTVKKKLARCPVIANARGNTPLYDFVQAAGFLVKPQTDIAAWIKSQRVQDLPPHLAPGVQQAMLHRQTWELRAGLLWHTEDVLSVLGEVFLTIKDRMQLWVDTLGDNTDLNDDQRARMTQMVDALQNEIHSKLVEMPKKRQTRSSIASQDAEMEKASASLDGSEE